VSAAFFMGIPLRYFSRGTFCALDRGGEIDPRDVDEAERRWIWSEFWDPEREGWATGYSP
jgi:hypothetical protein